MERGAAKKLVIAGAVLLVLGLIVGLAVSLIFGVLLILLSLGAFVMVFIQSAKAARAREKDSSDEDSSDEGSSDEDSSDADSSGEAADSGDDSEDD